jgi:hypothetical protein
MQTGCNRFFDCCDEADLKNSGFINSLGNNGGVAIDMFIKEKKSLVAKITTLTSTRTAPITAPVFQLAYSDLQQRLKASISICGCLQSQGIC